MEGPRLMAPLAVSDRQLERVLGGGQSLVEPSRGQQPLGEMSGPEGEVRLDPELPGERHTTFQQMETLVRPAEGGQGQPQQRGRDRLPDRELALPARLETALERRERSFAPAPPPAARPPPRPRAPPGGGGAAGGGGPLPPGGGG